MNANRKSRVKMQYTGADYNTGIYVGARTDDLRNVPAGTKWLTTEFVPTKRGLVIVLLPEIPEKPDQGKQKVGLL